MASGLAGSRPFAKINTQVHATLEGEDVAQSSQNSKGGFPHLELAGPTIEDDVRRLARRYGVEALQRAVREQTKPKRGAPSKDGDWRKIDEILRQDALRWLDGGDPFAERSNHSIAKTFYEPGAQQEFESLHRRIMRKLKDRRRYYTFVHAEMLSKDRYPYGDYLNVLAELVASGRLTDSWQSLHHLAQASIADYTAKYGPPDAALTMREIESEAAKPLPVEPATKIKNVLQLLADLESK